MKRYRVSFQDGGTITVTAGSEAGAVNAAWQALSDSNMPLQIELELRFLGCFLPASQQERFERVLAEIRKLQPIRRGLVEVRELGQVAGTMLNGPQEGQNRPVVPLSSRLAVVARSKEIKSPTGATNDELEELS